MFLSIVIPAYNEERLLPHCLASLPADDDIEVIVVDNNSTDKTAKIAHHAGAQVVFEAINQIGRARNAGAAAARGEWLLFLDADCVMSETLFADLRRVMSSGDAAGCGSLMRMSDLPWWARAMLGFWSFISVLFRWAAGSLILCRRQAFLDIGGFSDKLYAAEEVDLSRRLKAWGRARGLRFPILREHPLATSNRKLKLYSGREIAVQLLRLITRPWRSLTDKGRLSLWYDGRR